IATVVFIRAGWFPVIMKRDDRERYIDALERADMGDLRPLVALFVRAQRNALIEATEVALDAKPVSTVGEAVSDVRDRLLQRGKIPHTEWLNARTTAAHLLIRAMGSLSVLANALSRQVGGAGTNFQFVLEHGVHEPRDDRQAAIMKAGQIADF